MSHKTWNRSKNEMWQEGNVLKFSLFFLKESITKPTHSGKALPKGMCAWSSSCCYESCCYSTAPTLLLQTKPLIAGEGPALLHPAAPGRGIRHQVPGDKQRQHRFTLRFPRLRLLLPQGPSRSCRLAALGTRHSPGKSLTQINHPPDSEQENER